MGGMLQRFMLEAEKQRRRDGTMSKIPEFLVRVDYEIPFTSGGDSMYFEDQDSHTDAHYREALRVFYPNANIRKVERKVRPVPEGC